MTRTRHVHLIDAALVVAIIFPIVWSFFAAVVACELHQARLEIAASSAQWRIESNRRIDKLLWKVDTGLEIFGAMRLDTGAMLTKLRVQVKQSSDDSTKSAKVQTQAATVAVTQALDTTRQAIQVAANEAPDKPPQVEVKAEPDQITVNVPAPVVVEPTEKLTVPAPASKVKQKRSWYSHIWRWW